MIYLCGRLRKPEFEAQLGAAGVAVEPVETYDTGRVPPAATAAHARSIGPVDAVLVYSSEAAASLEALTREAGLAELFAAARFCCLSPGIAAVLAGVDPARNPHRSPADGGEPLCLARNGKLTRPRCAPFHAGQV